MQSLRKQQQVHRTSTLETSDYHIEHHGHMIRDSRGHIIDRFRHESMQQNTTYMVPHTNYCRHHNTCHLHNGHYYYMTPTVSTHREVAPCATQVQFGSFSHLDDLASRRVELTNEFLLDLHYNYSHNHGFRETYSEGYQLLEVAQYIHDAEHANDRTVIQAQLGVMDALLHHLQDDVRG